VASIPEEAWEALKALDPLIYFGDVWWLPAHVVNGFGDGKDRFCVILGWEVDADGNRTRVCVTAGTSQGASQPRLEVAPGEAELKKKTTFWLPVFEWVSPADVDRYGRFVGRLDDVRKEELRRVIGDASIAVLKGLRR